MDSFCLFFEIGSCYVAQASLKLMIPLPCFLRATPFLHGFIVIPNKVPLLFPFLPMKGQAQEGRVPATAFQWICCKAWLQSQVLSCSLLPKEETKRTGSMESAEWPRGQGSSASRKELSVTSGSWALHWDEAEVVGFRTAGRCTSLPHVVGVMGEAVWGTALWGRRGRVNSWLVLHCLQLGKSQEDMRQLEVRAVCYCLPHTHTLPSMCPSHIPAIFTWI
jgi:hypothetical protein